MFIDFNTGMYIAGNGLFDVEAVWGENSNPGYDPESAGNGGGYWQPCGGAVIRLSDGRLVTVEVEDLSCGDYGDRVYGSVEVDGYKWFIATGSMIELENDMEDAEWRSMSGVLGLDAEQLFLAVSDAVGLAAWENRWTEWEEAV